MREEMMSVDSVRACSAREMALCLLSAVSLSAGHALAVDTPPNPSVYFPSMGRVAALKAPPIDTPPTIGPDARRLLNRFPGVHPMSWRGNIIGFYGSPMTHGDSPKAAAETFIKDHGKAFGAGWLQLEPTWDIPLHDGRFHVFHYNQILAGLPVEFGRFTVVVRTDPQNPLGDLDNRVVQGKGRLASIPVGGFKPDLVTGATAVDIAKTLKGFTDLTTWSDAKQVVYFGEGDMDAWITPIRAWKITGELPGQPRKYSFFIDSATGEVVFIRGEVFFADVTGTVQANITPGGGCIAPGNPPTLRPLSDINVTSGATSALTDPLGAYTLSLAGAGPVNVSTTVGSGNWAQVFSPQEPTTPILNQTISALLPGSASFVLNTALTDFPTAQANGFFYQTLTHNYLKALEPAWTGIDFALPVNVNLNNSGGITSCNAFYNGASTNFFVNAGGCNNTAGGSVVSHEYGHHIVNQLGLAQGAFGEGFGDTMSMMIFDDPVIGRDFTTTGGVVRTPDTANTQYPCSGTEVHFCGQILAGSLWEIRKAYVNFFGPVDGLALVRQEHADWAMITSGGVGTASANPQTAIDWLTVDDNNGDINDGTPNYTRLASAYAMHSIPVPPILPLIFKFPDGLPESVRPGVASAIRVRIQAITATPNPSTAKLFYREGSSGAFAQASLTPTTGDEYRAVIPTTSCARVEYYFSVQDTVGATYLSPSNAPAGAYAIIATDGSAWSTVVADTFESGGAGWTPSESPSGTAAVTGQWTLGDPNGTAAQPEDDHTAAGLNCWFTGQAAAGATVGTNDVDSGSVTLTSPAFDLSGAADGRIGFWLWYNNFAGSAPDADLFTTQVSSDNGTTWVTADVVGPVTSVNFPGWQHREFRLLQVPGIAPSAQVRVRFIAEDAGSGSIVEAAVDDLLVERASCNLCLADLDDGSNIGTPDGGVDIADLLFFIARFELGDIAADLDNDGDPAQSQPDGGVDINDLLFFLSRFETGC